MTQDDLSIRRAISNYFINRNKYAEDVPIRESMYPSFEQLKDSPELREVLLGVSKEQKSTLLRRTIEVLIEEGIIDDKKFPGGLYHIIVDDLNARNFQTAITVGER